MTNKYISELILLLSAIKCISMLKFTNKYMSELISLLSTMICTLYELGH
jgi:hypothetical protein